MRFNKRCLRFNKRCLRFNKPCRCFNYTSLQTPLYMPTKYLLQACKYILQVFKVLGIKKASPDGGSCMGERERRA